MGLTNLAGWIALQKSRLQRLLSPGGTLSQRVVRGGFWVFALRIVDRLFKLVRTIVLARLLAPKDFGLFGIALLAMSALETFSQTGFQQALIQKKRDIKPYLDTAWTVQAIRGVVLASILFGIAPYVAAFFGERAAEALLRVLGLSMLFQGFTNIGMVYFQKELEFHKQFVYQLSATLVDLVVAITAALLLQNAWALIFGLLAGNLVRMVVSYLIHPHRPTVKIDWGKSKELFRFGRYILGTSVLKFLILQGDDAFLGKLLGAATLGLYQMAYGISHMMVTEISGAISQVTFPTYSKLQDNQTKLREGYLKTTQLTTMITFPIAGGISVLAPEFIQIVLGSQWLSMVPTLQILCLLGALKSIEYDTLFKSVGKPDIPMKVSLVRLMVIAVAIYPLTLKLGMAGTAVSVLVATLSIEPWCLYQAMQILNYRIRDFLGLISVPSALTLVMVLAMVGVKRLISFFDLMWLFLSVIIGAGIYLLMVCLLHLVYEYRAKELVGSIREAFSRNDTMPRY